jgi:hypothetical protein
MSPSLDSTRGDDNFTSVTRDNCGIYLCKGEQGNAGIRVWIGFDGDIFPRMKNSKKKE